MTWTITFLDSGREPQCKPNPKYPEGIDVDLRSETEKEPDRKYCCRNVPYPAPRCGAYLIDCDVCGKTVAVTVAGRADDPRSVTVACGKVS